MSKEVKALAILSIAIAALCVGVTLGKSSPRHDTERPTDTVAVTTPATVDSSSADSLVIQAAWAQISADDRDGVCQMFNIDQDTSMSMIVSDLDDPPDLETLRSFLEGVC